jgi:PAS domain S-box-containing protein
MSVQNNEHAQRLGKSDVELISARNQLHEFAQFIEFAFDGVFVTGGDGNILLINSAYERITGLKRENFIGHNIREMVEDGVIDQSVSLKVIETGQPVTLNQRIKTGVSVLVSGNPLFDANGKIHHVVATIRDMAELRRLRDEIDILGGLKTQYEDEVRKLKIVLAGQEDLVFRSASIRAIVDLAQRLGTVDSTVLLQGESGVGKEIIATLIHKSSPQRYLKPFIKINCAAIPDQLLESELFGYVKGSFTGASKEGKIGLFEAANGGTLLLDEVGDISLALQVKLLRVIQEKQIRRIGENTMRGVDVRLLAATHQDLAKMVEQGKFRGDLYYRLNVIPLNIPPLRERKDDILVLAQKFLEKYCLQHKLDKTLHSSVLPLQLDYPWPGNVRELENIMERIVVTSPGTVIAAHDLPSIFASSIDNKAEILAGKTLPQMVDSLEISVLKQAFAQYGSTGKVAENLGLHRSNIVRKARRHGLLYLLKQKKVP